MASSAWCRCWVRWGCCWWLWYSRSDDKARGFRFWNVLVWLVIAACIGGAGFMEYYVQRHGDLAAFSYSIMSACLLAAAGLVLLLRKLAQPVRRRR